MKENEIEFFIFYHLFACCYILEFYFLRNIVLFMNMLSLFDAFVV